MKVLILSVGYPVRRSKTGKKLTEKEAIDTRIKEGPESVSLKRYKDIKKVYFVASSETKKLAVELNRKLLDGDKGEILEINKDNLDDIIEKVKKVVLKENKNQLLINATGGTKLMSIGLGYAAAYAEDAVLLYETGKRGENGLVVLNEKQVKSDVSKHRDNLFLNELFKKRYYSTCLEMLEKGAGFVGARDSKKLLLKPLVRAYNEWDLFDHKKAYSNLKEYERRASEQLINISDIPCKKRNSRKKSRTSTPCQDQFISFLEKLKDKEKKEYRVLDIYFNALRRKDQGRFDDAVARLYRVIEAIAQLRLEKKYGINSANVSLKNKHVKKLGKKIIQALKNKRISYDKKIKLGLVEDYWLLSELNDSLYSKIYSEHLSKRGSSLQHRNMSILAHGYEPVGEKNFEELKKLADQALVKFKEEYNLEATARQMMEISSTKKLPPELL